MAPVIRLNKRWMHCVIDDDGKILLDDATNAEAWKFIDRLNGEPTSKAEDRTAYLQKKQGI